MEMREIGLAAPPRTASEWRLQHTTRLADYRGRLSTCLLELLDASTTADRRRTLTEDAAVLQALIKNVEDELTALPPPLPTADVSVEPHVDVSTSICLNRMREYIMPLTLFKIVLYLAGFIGVVYYLVLLLRRISQTAPVVSSARSEVGSIPAPGIFFCAENDFELVDSTLLFGDCKLVGDLSRPPPTSQCNMTVANVRLLTYGKNLTRCGVLLPMTVGYDVNINMVSIRFFVNRSAHVSAFGAMLIGTFTNASQIQDGALVVANADFSDDTGATLVRFSTRNSSYSPRAFAGAWSERTYSTFVSHAPSGNIAVGGKLLVQPIDNSIEYVTEVYPFQLSDVISAISGVASIIAGIIGFLLGPGVYEVDGFAARVFSCLRHDRNVKADRPVTATSFVRF